MPKTPKITALDLEKTIMAKVKSNEISMKPRWYFIFGSLLTVASLIGLSIGAVFLTNITLFLLRKHGPLGQWRLGYMLSTFPWWVPALAIIGGGFGIWMLKKYDFSYKKNFGLIVLGFVVSIMLAAFILDYSGLNDAWSRRGAMRGFYQKIEGQNMMLPRAQNHKW